MTEPYLHRILRALAALGPTSAESLETYLHLSPAKRTYLHNWVDRAMDQQLIARRADGLLRLTVRGRTHWVRILRRQLHHLDPPPRRPAARLRRRRRAAAR